MQESPKTTGAKHIYRWLWGVPASLCGLVALVSVIDLAWPGFFGGVYVWSDGRRIIGPLASILLTAGFAALACDVDVMGYLKRDYNKSGEFGVSMGWTRLVVGVAGWAVTGMLTLLLFLAVLAQGESSFATLIRNGDGWDSRFIYALAPDWIGVIALATVTAGVFYRTSCATFGTPRTNRFLVDAVKASPWIAIVYLASAMLWT